MEKQIGKQTGGQRRRRKKEYCCHLCGRKLPFCWICRCGFQICSDCMEENMWGMTCNAITWTCPDCGEQRGYGNQ